MKKAKEVKELVEQLTGAGLAAEDIHLQSIHTENTSGPVLKSSNATYRLRLRCNKLEKVPDLLGVITAQKNATFERVDWKYADEEAREKGMEQALRKAHARAGKVAGQLGVKLLGIYHFEDDTSDDELRGTGHLREPPWSGPCCDDAGEDRGVVDRTDGACVVLDPPCHETLERGQVIHHASPHGVASTGARCGYECQKD